MFAAKTILKCAKITQIIRGDEVDSWFLCHPVYLNRVAITLYVDFSGSQ